MILASFKFVFRAIGIAFKQRNLVIEGRTIGFRNRQDEPVIDFTYWWIEVECRLNYPTDEDTSVPVTDEFVPIYQDGAFSKGGGDKNEY